MLELDVLEKDLETTIKKEGDEKNYQGLTAYSASEKLKKHGFN